MNISFNNSIPIYLQISDHIKTLILSNILTSGEKLPSVREYASMFKVNPNTIQKALSDLEQNNLIYTESTNGKFVTNNKVVIEKLRKEYADNIVNTYYSNMEKIGISKNEAIIYLRKEKD